MSSANADKVPIKKVWNKNGSLPTYFFSMDEVPASQRFHTLCQQSAQISNVRTFAVRSLSP